MGFFKGKMPFVHIREELRRKPFSFLISFCAILFFIVFLSARHSAGVVPPNEKRLVYQRRSLKTSIPSHFPSVLEVHFMFHTTI